MLFTLPAVAQITPAAALSALCVVSCTPLDVLAGLNTLFVRFVGFLLSAGVYRSVSAPASQPAVEHIPHWGKQQQQYNCNCYLHTLVFCVSCVCE